MRLHLVVATLAVVLTGVRCGDVTTVAPVASAASSATQPASNDKVSSPQPDAPETEVDEVPANPPEPTEDSEPGSVDHSKPESSASGDVADSGAALTSREGRDLEQGFDPTGEPIAYEDSPLDIGDYQDGGEGGDAEVEESELTEEERLQILEELRQLNTTELEQLPQPEMFISHVRDYWRRQEESQRRIRNEILDMIVPRKKRPPVRGPPPQGVPGPPPPRPPSHRSGGPPGGRRKPHRPLRDEVLGHQLPPPKYSGRPRPERREDAHAQASRPAPAPFLFKVPGEGVIQLPPPPSHVANVNSDVFPPPFPVGAPAGKPGRSRHGNDPGRRHSANQDAPPRRSPNQDQRRRPPANHEPPRRPSFRPNQDRDHDHHHRHPHPHDENSRRHEIARPEPDRFRPGPGPRRPEIEPRRPPPFIRPPFERDEPLTFDAPSKSGGQRPLDLGAPDRGRFTPTRDTDFGGSSFAPFRPVSNDLGGGPRRECDFYDDGICLNTNVYPRDAIQASLNVERPLVDAMFAEVREQSADVLVEGVSSQQEATYDYTHYFGSESRISTERRGIESHSHRDFAQDGGYLCPSEVKYARPKRAKNSKGEWKFIVNMDRYTQTLRMEKCMRPGGSCSYVSHHYKSQCSQVSNYHRLLSWDKQRGLHMDIFKVPVACSCHIQGYAYVYPPLGGAAVGGQSNINERIDIGHGVPTVQTGIGRSRTTLSEQDKRPPPPPRPTQTTTTTTTTTATTTTTQRVTTTRRPYRGISRLRPTRRRRPGKTSTFPPYRPSRPGHDKGDSHDSPINVPGLGGTDDQMFGGFGDKIPADSNEIRRRLDGSDASSSGTYQVPAVVPAPPSYQPPRDPPPPEERVNYGYHPIIDFFGK